MEVFATKFNITYHLDKIINRQLRPEVSEYLLEDLIFNRKNNNYLTDYQIEQCYYLVEFLNAPETFLKKHGKEWYDTKTFYKEARPCYHSSPDCERMNADFVNVSLPQRLKNNEAIVKLFRNTPSEILIKEKSESIISELCLKINTQFNLDKPVANKEFTNFDIDTGPNMRLEDDLDELIMKTEELHYKTEDYLTKNPNILPFRKQNFNPPSYEEFLHDYSYNYKSATYLYSVIYQDIYYLKRYLLRPIKKRLRYYTLGKMNKEVKFNKSLLESLGFRSCKVC